MGLSRIRPYEPSDRDAVLNLYGRHWGEGDTGRLERYWDWLLACPPNSASTRPLFLVQERNGERTGLIACLPRRLVLNGESHNFYWIADFLVDPHMGSPFDAVRLVRKLWPHSAEALFGGIPLAGTVPLWRRAGGAGHIEVHPAPPEWRVPLSWRPPGGGGPARRALRTLRRLPRRLRTGTNRLLEEGQSKEGDLVASVAPSIDRRFEQLSDRHSGEERAHLAREAAYLTWRFLRCPHRHHEVITAETTEGALRGYAVLAGPHQRTGSAEGPVLDLLTEPGDIEAARLLIAESARRSRARGARDLVVAGDLSDGLASLFRGLGALRTDGARPLVFHARAVEGPLRGLLANRSALRFPGELGTDLGDF